MKPLALLFALLAFCAHAQPGKIHRVAYLSFPSLPSVHFDAFRQGLRELGYVEGRNLVLATVSAEGVRDRLPGLAAELVSAKPDVIVVTTGLSAIALKRATRSIPIVMTGSSDAVAMSIVESLARPGGNVTGFTLNSPELAPKRLELLTSLPGITRIAVAWCPTTAINVDELKRTSQAAARLRLRIEAIEYRQGATTWESMSAALAEARPHALFMLDCTALPMQQLEAFAVAHRLPLMSPYHVRGGNHGVLLAYGADTLKMAQRAAGHVDKILKGANPADLPVEQPAELELVVNLKTARAIGLTLPQPLLLRASRIIQP